MASLGFRPPQFSEDLAWLPNWLQNPQIESSTGQVHETLTNNNNSSTQLQLHTFSRDDSRNNHFNLFLSGDFDTSQFSASPSLPSNVLHFCLRFSSDGESQQSESCDLNMYQPLVQRVETSAVSNVGPLSLINKEEIEGENGEKVDCNPDVPSCKDNVEVEERFKVKCVEDADVHDAVELSIAASEALVIHELMCTGSTSDFVSTGAILEAALQVKQARLEGLQYGNCCISHEVDDLSNLSELDLDMENAFLDVGLSFSNTTDQHAGGSDVSLVKDTPLDSHYAYNGSKHVLKISNDSALGLNNINMADLVDQPADPISHIPAMAQPQVDVSSLLPCRSENSEGEKKVCSLVVDKFRSRWLGGWTVKEADTSAKLKQNNSKGVSKFFDFETSFLSESAEAAADENSFVRKYDSGSEIASQPSIHFGNVVDKADAEISFPHELRSSSQSLVDPLCSVVPCSISSENVGSPLAQNQDDREANAQKCCSSKSEHRMEYLLRTSDVNVEPSYVNREAVPTASGEYFEAPVQRRLASFKSSSTLLSEHEAILNGQQLNQNKLSSSEYIEELISSNVSSDQMNSKLFLAFGSEFQSSVGRDLGQNQLVNILRNPLSDHDEHAKERPGQQLHPSTRSRSPLVLNRRMRCHLQPSELLVGNLAGERTPEQIEGQGTITNAFQKTNLQKTASQFKNPCRMPNLVRKQVRFSVEVGIQQNKDIPKAQNSQRNSSAIRANTRSKCSKPWSDCRTQDVKSCFKGCINEVKRLIFHGLQFLLTGFSSRKEREISRLIQQYGGMVLMDVPSLPPNSRAKRSATSNFQQLPIVICSKKLKTTKFLYGCAVNALILKVKWLSDSVAAGSIIPPEKYIIISNYAVLQYSKFGTLGHHDNTRRIFDTVGIMLHGKHSFCTKLATIIMHGGGQVFRTLHMLFQSLDAEKISIGAIVVEDESRASRHLKHCASERKLPTMPASWITKSLHFGKLLPFKEKDDAPTIKAPESATSLDWSQEI